MELFVVQFLLVIAAVIITLIMQALDDFLSQRGVVSVLQGGLLGYGQVHVARELPEWGGGRLGWVVVVLIAIGAMALSVYKIRNTWICWFCSYDFGRFVGILYGGFSLILH